MDINFFKQNKFSLLWPEGSGQEYVIDENDYIINDLSINKISESLSINNMFKLDNKFLLSILSSKEEVLRYRLDILEDFINNPSVYECFESILSLIEELSIQGTSGRFSAPAFQQVIWRLGELDMYAECVSKLNSVLNNSNLNIRSQGLQMLSEYIKTIADSDIFNSVITVLPELKSGLKNLSSVSIGVNLDHNLRAYEATILSINDKPFKGDSVIHRLIRGKNSDNGNYIGISQLLKVENLARPGEPPIYDAFQVTLFEQLNKVFRSTSKTIEDALRKYISVSSDFLVALKRDIIFMLGAAKLVNKIKSSGLSMCKPEIWPIDKREFFVENIYNLNLAINMYNTRSKTALDELIVMNNVDFGDNGRIFILTGPNQGGKTTYIQAIGIAQLLCQLGIFVTGTKARISPVDRIFTHFPVEEKPDENTGRLGEESGRIHEIFNLATSNSIILFNESLSSTSFSEGLYISREIIMALRVLGGRAVFATHFHELAENLDAYNEKIPGDSKIVSMVSGTNSSEEKLDGVSAARRTYKIEPGPPQGLSYARDIASKHGLDFKQIIKLFQSRNIISENVNAENIDINKLT
ncbi:MAG: mismatch repair protein [Eubacterium sp.]|nr:mismatch repair protein [Eubacterium sp.]